MRLLFQCATTIDRKSKPNGQAVYMTRGINIVLCTVISEQVNSSLSVNTRDQKNTETPHALNLQIQKYLIKLFNIIFL